MSKRWPEQLDQLDFAQEVLYLPPEEAAAIQTLVQGNGRSPVAAFERLHGELRLMGPGAWSGKSRGLTRLAR